MWDLRLYLLSFLLCLTRFCKICLIWVKTVGDERGIVCIHREADDLWKTVPPPRTGHCPSFSVLHIWSCVSSLIRVNTWYWWLNEIGSWITHASLSPIPRGFAPCFVNCTEGALNSKPQVIKSTSYLPMVGCSLRILQLPPPLELVAMM